MQKTKITLLTAAAVLGLIIPATAAAAPASAPATVAKGFNSCGYQPTTTLMLRTGPSKKNTAIGQLHKGDVVAAHKASGAWYKVSTSYNTPSGLRAGTQGWVAKKYLKAEVCMQLD
ncbi:SH3 domain-containing protein [Streptomyces sp. ITFR-6]|uniref:SH3 domain-containing protein n=1 Tax=Streptomyces sp. ITFR-6 TaxID=3075197 RepID=UPI002889D610|nr:SH3 domain-containing protein [Streptomyces sp. ITFR-6]WNI31371.1 SH3 domain-containing protein [Streptomyces sp. ITFR-6]